MEALWNILSVMPVKTGIQELYEFLDSGMRRNDEAANFPIIIVTLKNDFYPADFIL